MYSLNLICTCLILLLRLRLIVCFTCFGTKEDIAWDMASTERNDEWQNISKQRPRRKQQQWFRPPLMPEPILPTSSNKSFEPFIILLVGLPGSGKSTFAESLAFAMPFKFTRVNQDQLKTRQKCITRAKHVLAEGKCPIIDRCNFDEAQRRTWMKLAKTHKVPIDAVILQVPLSLCITRCQERQNHETIEPSQAKRIVLTVNSQLKLPDRSESSNFRSILNISNSAAFSRTIDHYLNKQA